VVVKKVRKSKGNKSGKQKNDLPLQMRIVFWGKKMPIQATASEVVDCSSLVKSEGGVEVPASALEATPLRPPNAGRELLGLLVSVGSESWRPILAVLIMEDDEEGDVLLRPGPDPFCCSDRPSVPKSREEREPMLKKPLLPPFKAEDDP